jgi:hypothetical protein
VRAAAAAAEHRGARVSSFLLAGTPQTCHANAPFLSVMSTVFHLLGFTDLKI